ncbi:glycosyltransferase family 4 protein [Pendulispora albinea]|uniref:Glycosyltransferase family 4 protein n=1 Tax=Pendulispora albinea TaxID=2741071 RepID=A0ABZ2M2X6_9BACT
MRKVLFVSKPIVPPWHDGSKNLVRDIASHLTRARPTVMTTEGAPPLGPRVGLDPIYREAGGFSPGVLTNARVMRRLMTDRAHDIWHFVFAPNVASSSAARFSITSRRALGWNGQVVQTIASAPKRFELAPALLFGDVVVTLTEWTRARLLAEGVDGKKLRVIPPCSAPPRAVSDEERTRLREELDLGTGPILVYPGDYEVSRGAETVAYAVSTIARAVPEARVVFACRPKTPRAAAARAQIERILEEERMIHRTRHVGQMADIAPLIASASAVLFPVDDLYGKVDLPIVLLEALALGVPLVLARGGPLEALSAADFVDPGDGPALARAALQILRGGASAEGRAERGRALYASQFAPEVVAARYDELYERLRP